MAVTWETVIQVADQSGNMFKVFIEAPDINM